MNKITLEEQQKLWTECCDKVAKNWFKENGYGDQYSRWVLLSPGRRIYLSPEVGKLFAAEMVKKSIPLSRECWDCDDFSNSESDILEQLNLKI